MTSAASITPLDPSASKKEVASAPDAAPDGWHDVATPHCRDQKCDTRGGAEQEGDQRRFEAEAAAGQITLPPSGSFAFFILEVE